MRGGIGSASITLPSGLTVAAIVAVNAIGDVVDPTTGRIVAGTRAPDGTGFANARVLMRQGARIEGGTMENTSIGVVATNAVLTKPQATKVAQMAHDGVARAIVPSHLPMDGDVIFSLATGRLDGPADVAVIGALAAEVVAEAILRAVEQATGLEGIPSATDLGTRRP